MYQLSINDITNLLWHFIGIWDKYVKILDFYRNLLVFPKPYYLGIGNGYTNRNVIHFPIWLCKNMHTVPLKINKLLMFEVNQIYHDFSLVFDHKYENFRHGIFKTMF